ncbi:unnamed protein product [Musa acuminata var. zebrina]
MEEHKDRALTHFLKRANKSLQDVRTAMAEVVQQLRGAYQSLDGKWAGDEMFLHLMILDGCFMLEIIRRDMMMFENQLPLLVLYKLVFVEGRGDCVEYVNELVLTFWDKTLTVEGERRHLLDMLRLSRLGKQSSAATSRGQKTVQSLDHPVGV